MPTPINVLIIEDSSVFREALERVINKFERTSLYGSFGMAERGLRFIATSAKKPDVVILDLQLPGMSGLEAIPLIKREVPSVKIVILTQSEKEEDLMEAVSHDVSSFLLKSTSSKQVINAIITTHEGNTLFDQHTSKIINDKLRSIKVNHSDKTLTPRELQILILIAEGLSKKQISAELGISNSTAVTHTISIYQKLEATNAPSAIANAYAKGILVPLK